MNNNELLRSLRKLLALNENGMADLFSLTPHPADSASILAWLRHENEPGFQPCPDAAVTHLLEGMILHRRGPREPTQPAVVEPAPDNNQTLKKLRVAFDLRDEDMHSILQSVDVPLTKQELGALFRKPGHKNFKPCSDQLLRQFLKGLTERIRTG